MFNKNDPLIDSVSKIMKENQIRRDVEQALNEELGIHSKKDLPFEQHAEYNAVLEEAIQEALKGNQHKIDLNKNNRLDKQDFKMLRAKKEKKPEEHGVEAEREMASKGQKMYEEEANYSAKKARAGKDIGKPGKMFSKIAASAAKKYGSEERGKKVAGAVLAKLRSKTMKEESEESDPAPASLQEKAPPGAKFERMVKHIKDKYKKDGLTDKEKSIAYATAWKAKNKEKELDEEGFIDTMKKVYDTVKGAASAAATGGATPAGQPKPTTSLALGGASTQASAPPVGAGPGSVAPAPKPTATPFTKGGPATRSVSVPASPVSPESQDRKPVVAKAPTPTSKPSGSEVAASRAANVPDSRTLRAPVKAPAGEGKVGQGLAATGISAQDRRNQAFVDKTLGAGKYKAGSAQANMALLAKSREQRAAVTSTEKPTRVNPAAKLTTGGSARE